MLFCNVFGVVKSVYLAAVRNMHISLGFPDPRDQSSFSAIAEAVQADTACMHVQAMKPGRRPQVRLLVTPRILELLRGHMGVDTAP